MDWLQFLWDASLIAMLIALPMGVVRMIALSDEGGFEHSRTMKISAGVAVGVGVAALLLFVVLTIVLLA